MFYISGPDLELETENFKQLAAAFWAKRASAQLLAA
jgi:hypothetical protein